MKETVAYRLAPSHTQVWSGDGNELYRLQTSYGGVIRIVEIRDGITLEKASK